MQYDVVIVGAGPAGLACAIRLKQLKPDVSVCVLEKASAVGAHSLSGAVLEPGPLEQLLPEWSREYPGMKVPASADDFRIFTRRGSFQPVPGWLVRLLPRSMTYSTPFNNHGNYIISLGQLTPWLAPRRRRSASRCSPGFAAAAPLFDEHGGVKGVRIGDMGLDRDGEPGPNFTPGVEIHAPLTVLAEGARGSLAKQLIARFDLAARALPADLRPRATRSCGSCRPGACARAASSTASAGRRTAHTYAGSFLYHLDNDRVYVGYIVGLDYQDPRLQPFEAFQQYKNHPSVKAAARGRRDHLGRGAHDRRGRLAIDADARDAGRDADRRCRRDAQLRQDQGRAPGDPLRRARRRAHRAKRHRRRLRCQRWRASRGRPGARAGAQLQARVQARAVVGPGQLRVGDAHRGPLALDTEEQRRLVAPAQARRVHISRSRHGSSARCRRAIASRSCSSPATPTRRASRCT